MARLVEFFLGDYVTFETFSWFNRYKGEGEIVAKSTADPNNNFIVEYIDDTGEKVRRDIPATDLRLMCRGKQIFHSINNYLLPPKQKKKKSALWTDLEENNRISRRTCGYITKTTPLPSKFIPTKSIGRKRKY